jgi:hypothetical protein
MPADVDMIAVYMTGLGTLLLLLLLLAVPATP